MLDRRRNHAAPRPCRAFVTRTNPNDLSPDRKRFDSLPRGAQRLARRVCPIAGGGARSGLEYERRIEMRTKRIMLAMAMILAQCGIAAFAQEPLASQRGQIKTDSK